MQKTCVREIMTSPVIVISPDTPVSVANSIMRDNRIRHLPVVENDRLVGLVSFGDLREASTSASINADSYELNFMLTQLAVSRLMKRKVITVTPETLIVDAAELMIEHKIAGLPVIDAQNTVVGIIAGFDLLKMLVQKIREAESAESAK